MLKTLIRIASLAAVFSFAATGYSQALPTATARGALQVGLGWTYAQPDYGQKSIQGVTGWGDFDFTPHLGVEAEYHYVALETPTDLGENSFLIGPRAVMHRGRFSLYGKALIGIGDIDIQETQDNPEGGAGSYLAYGVGAGLDVRAWRRLFVRPIDFEYQHWSYATGLTPTALTFGFGYRFR